MFMAVLYQQLAHAQNVDAQNIDVQNTEMRSPEEQRAVTAALDRLMAEQDWYLAEKVARNYIASPAHTAGFYSRAIEIFTQNALYDEARLLSQIALEFYPDYAPFHRTHAQLLARAGHCHRAQTSWQAYRALAHAPIREREQIYFDSYCGTTTKARNFVSGTLVREGRLSQAFGPDEVIAKPGSLLHQLCSLAIVLCPEDGRFALDRPPPERTAITLRYHSIVAKRYSWRNHVQIDLELMKQLGGYRKSHLQIATHYKQRLSPYRMIGLRLRYKEALIPKFAGFEAQLTASPFIDSQFYHQLSQRLRAEGHLSYGASEVRRGHQRATSHQLIATQGFYWQADKHQEVGTTFLHDRISPPHNDEFGRQERVGYGLSYHYRHDNGFAVQLAFERSKTSFEKTLPFLVRPHRIVEKQTFLHISKPLDSEKRIIPFVHVGQVSRLSDNPRQHGKRTHISAGLSFRY